MNEATQTPTHRSDRIYVRMPVEIVVGSQGNQISHAATTVNFSTHGARVQTKVALVPGEQADFIWHGAKPQQLQCRVVWSAPGRLEQWQEAGLQFVEPLRVAV